MTDSVYTAITFAPVQGFIEKSRKLRDLYGSSFILSFLADHLCEAARDHLAATGAPWPQDPVVSPAQINTAEGTPNQIVIRGLFPEAAAQAAFDQAWTTVVDTCRQWVEQEIPHQPNGTPWDYRCWRRPWQQWANYAWELFWATGTTIDEARMQLNHRKRSRGWVGINWVGESSTLSGLDARVWPLLGHHAPHTRAKGDEEAEVKAFYGQLQEKLQEATFPEREQLSIPELVKRLITVGEVNCRIDGIRAPQSFRDLGRRSDAPRAEAASGETDDEAECDRQEARRWTGWFMGDGDRAGAFLLQKAKQNDDPAEVLHQFSLGLREWGHSFYQHLPRSPRPDGHLRRDGRIVYAGGDDFLGVLFRNAPAPPLTAQECLDWFYDFPKIWELHEQPISASVGFVWAAPNVPQRDLLQHCRLAEKSAKKQGRDRIAIRILFNDGKHLEWACPWRFLPLLTDYCDRSNQRGPTANWTHLYSDIATLQARHALSPHQIDVALGLFQLYFQPAAANVLGTREPWAAADQTEFYHLIQTLRDRGVPTEKTASLWNQYDADGMCQSTGLLGDWDTYCKDDILQLNQVSAALNQWVINLARVGFHLHRQSPYPP
jgi:CRISPR-associated protein Cmr2